MTTKKARDGVQTLTLGGVEYVVIPREEYERLVAGQLTKTKIRLSATELAAAKRAAKESGLTLQEWLRALVVAALERPAKRRAR